MSANDPSPPPPGPRSRAAAVLRAVHASPGITRAQLARDLGMSSGTAADTIARLVAQELVAERPVDATGAPGRPTRALGPHPAGPLVAVAAIAHESWEVATVALGGEVVESISARHARDRPAVLDAVTAALGGFVAAPRVRMAVVSVPGTVSGLRLVQAANLGWEDVDLAGLVLDAGALLAGNDASFAALAEARRGPAVGAASSVHLYMDSGVGGAVVEDGRLVRGATGRAGEFGHMPFGDPEARCRCGARGCWNTALDGHALAAALGRPVPGDDVSLSRAVLAAARAGAEDERRVLQAAGTAFGRGAAGLANALDPAVLTVGGLAAELLELVGDEVAEAYDTGLMATLAQAPPPLRAGSFGARAPLVGAAEAAFDVVLGAP